MGGFKCSTKARVSRLRYTGFVAAKHGNLRAQPSTTVTLSGAAGKGMGKVYVKTPSFALSSEVTNACKCWADGVL